MNRFERLARIFRGVEAGIALLSPKWAESRARSRVMARHYEAAAGGRRTEGWSRRSTDANNAASGVALQTLRNNARDLARNNPWARNGLRLIANDVVGWGIRPKATGRGAKRVRELWKRWAESTQCDAQGRMDFYGLQWLAMRAVAESGEVLIRRRTRLPSDGLAVPMQLQVLEPDYIDTSRDGIKGPGGGDIIQGIEHDLLGRRVAYWLFDQHPGGKSLVSPVSKRIAADSILHVFDVERPGQVRGPSWFASVDVKLHDFDEYEDATLMKQKIAACLAAFVTDVDGSSVALGEGGTDAKGQPTDYLEPGMILNLPPGKTVTTTNPPTASDHQSFSTTQLRAVAAGLGVTYESLTGDFSQTNYSSARMGANVHALNVQNWRHKMLIPQLCDPVFRWMISMAALAGEPVGDELATWTPPPALMLDPDKEAQGSQRQVRAGMKTHFEMIREQGYDPDDFLDEYEAGIAALRKRGIVLDSDAGQTSSSGQAQSQAQADEGDDESVDVDMDDEEDDSGEPADA